MSGNRSKSLRFPLRLPAVRDPIRRPSLTTRVVSNYQRARLVVRELAVPLSDLKKKEKKQAHRHDEFRACAGIRFSGDPRR